jgi:uncharacterized protein
MTDSANPARDARFNHEAGPAIASKIACLQQARTYPDQPAKIDVIETHMSWVFLTPHHAYKLKKPVRTGFLDFSTLEARTKNCTEELRLNRRLAPDVYLDMVPLVLSSSGDIRLEQTGEVIDWLVKMRRLPAERMLDYMISHATLKPAEIEQVAVLLAQFYQSCPPIDMSGADYRVRLDQKIRGNLSALGGTEFGISPARLRDIQHGLMKFLERNAVLFAARAAGQIVEGHGDLRPEHICLEPRPVIFDCLEFNREFRILDTADELAFLDMECERLGAPEVGLVLFQTYAKLSGDRPPRSLIAFYKANSACLRAKLAVWHIRDVEKSRHIHWRDIAVGYLELAARYVQELTP